MSEWLAIANENRYILTPMKAPDSITLRPPLHWLIIGIIALSISGLFSIVLAVAWHPSVKSVELFATLFHRSLVSHVNLSITVWFLCCLFMIWAYHPNPTTHNMTLPYMQQGAKWLMVIASLLMSAASLHPDAVAVMSNYVPVLQHSWFSLSIGCMVSSILLMIVDTALSQIGNKDTSIISTLTRTSLVMMVLALAAFAMSASALRGSGLSGEIYYEMLFWGGGHVMQFIWAQLLLFSWIALLSAIHPRLVIHQGYHWLFYTNMVVSACSLLPYALYDVIDPAFRQLCTSVMIWGGGIAPIGFIALYVANIRHHHIGIPLNTALGSAMWCSLSLFAIGGLFASMIDGINVKIPSHYHGSLLGVTVALMGLTYLVLQQHGYRYILTSKLIVPQFALLGGGQVLHIVGLFWSGGYGVQRKSPGAGGDAMEQADLALRVQSSGGGIAIIGGLLFIVICIKAWKKGKSSLA